MKQAVLILPTQLFKEHPALKALEHQEKLVILYEHPRFFTDFTFHKQKLLLHRASMKAYHALLPKLTKKSKSSIAYIEYTHSLFSFLQKEKINTVHLVEIVDTKVTKEIVSWSQKNGVQIVWYSTPAFLTTKEELQELLGQKERYFFTTFYKKQRLKLGILVEGTKPVGGAWSLDNENRKKLPTTIRVPQEFIPSVNSFIEEARTYVDVHFFKNPGTTQDFTFPTTHSQAEQQLDYFLENKLLKFGDYEDAISRTNPFLFHSQLSSSLNIGLLTPQQVVDKTIKYANKHSIGLNNLEGFIRQIIGWREYMRALYLLKENELRSANLFNLSTKVPASFWTASTGIEPVDTVIKSVLRYSYAHHIERLMVMGNFMLLCKFSPESVYTWFMELFIDAYDWVMVPNVFGMSQYSAGNIMTTKPYISSSRYILSMSDFKRDTWCTIWDSLYWNFIREQYKILQAIPRLQLTLSYTTRMSAEQLKKHQQQARSFLASLS